MLLQAAPPPDPVRGRGQRGAGQRDLGECRGGAAADLRLQAAAEPGHQRHLAAQRGHHHPLLPARQPGHPAVQRRRRGEQPQPARYTGSSEQEFSRNFRFSCLSPHTSKTLDRVFCRVIPKYYPQCRDSRAVPLLETIVHVSSLEDVEPRPLAELAELDSENQVNPSA